MRDRPRINAIITRYPRVSLTILGTIAAILLFAAFEGAVWLFRQTQKEPERVYTGGVPAPGTSGRNVLRVDGEVSYDVVYTMDARGLRVSPDSAIDSPERIMFFFGGSFTFGTGVNDAETLPNQVARQWSGTTVHNYGLPGRGTLHAYEQVDLIRPKDISGFRGDIIGVYVFFTGHIRRNIGTMRLVANWAKNFPHYEFDTDGNLVRLGTFEETRPFLTKLQYILNKEQLLLATKSDWPAIRAEHIQFTVRVIGALQNKFETATRSDQFYVMIIPAKLNDSDHVDEIIRLLDESGIAVLDFSETFDPEQSPYRIYGDSHVSAAAYERLGRAVVHEMTAASGEFRMEPGP